jgi:CubicO group peptidase (beta-lactamase class C family)
MNRLCFVVLILVSAALPANAQARLDAAAKQKIRDYLEARESRGEFSGTVAVRLNGRELYRHSAGKADYELSALFTPKTKFRLASLTKSFTAVAVSLLLKQGALSLDDPLSKFLPEFPNGDQITVRHLLMHKSGIGQADPVSDPGQKFTLREAIERFRLKTPYFAPGTSDRYSNEGYILLAYIVEKASGKSYSEFLQSNIFDPLGLRDTGNFGSSKIVPNRARLRSGASARARAQHIP